MFYKILVTNSISVKKQTDAYEGDGRRTDRRTDSGGDSSDRSSESICFAGTGTGRCLGDRKLPNIGQ